MCDRRRKEGNRLTMKFMKRITSAALALLLCAVFFDSFSVARWFL